MWFWFLNFSCGFVCWVVGSLFVVGGLFSACLGLVSVFGGCCLFVWCLRGFFEHSRYKGACQIFRT